jgi:hypothetical protein
MELSTQPDSSTVWLFYDILRPIFGSIFNILCIVEILMNWLFMILFQSTLYYLSVCTHTTRCTHIEYIMLYIYTHVHTLCIVCVYIYIIIMYIILCTYIYMHIWMYLSRLFKVMTRWHCQEKARGSGCSFDHTSYCDAKLPSEGRRSSSNPRKTSMLCVFLLNLYWLRQEEQSCFLAMLWLHCIE